MRPIHPRENTVLDFEAEIEYLTQLEERKKGYWTLNGAKHPLDRDTVSFEDIAEMVYGKRGIFPTITYCNAAQEKTEGILVRGQSVRLGPKTHIDCIFTNCA